MEDKKYTAEGLPVVAKSLLEVLERDYDKDLSIYGEFPKEDDDSIFSREIEEFANSNRALFGYIENRAKCLYRNVVDLTNRERLEDVFTICYFFGAVSCYAALRRQAEAYRLEKELENR